MVATITASLICYLLGSLNTAIIVGWLRGIDIRAVGTKNAGATNAWHSIGKKEGFIIGAIDFIKGVWGWKRSKQPAKAEYPLELSIIVINYKTTNRKNKNILNNFCSFNFNSCKYLFIFLLFSY